MELGPFMHKHPILDLGPLGKYYNPIYFIFFYSNLMVKGSLYVVEMFLYMKKRLTQFFPKVN